MLEKSVGKNGINQSDDVEAIQKIINLRDDLRGTLPKLVEDGDYGAKTQAAIEQIQANFMSNPDGIIDPFGNTINKMWPVAYANPTGLAIRGTDAYGSGFHGAPRGSRIHDGVDYVSIAGQQVNASLSGKVIKLSRPYSSGIDAAELAGVQIVASDGSCCWMWYMQPLDNIVGSIVKAGDSMVGSAKTLQNRYTNGMTDHIHIRLHDRQDNIINAEDVIK